MPLEREVDFLAIDEAQLAADAERGRIFTSRILHARGKSETLFLGSDTLRPVLQRLFNNIQFLSRERFSELTFTGSKKLTRLPRRSAIVAFLKRQRLRDCRTDPAPAWRRSRSFGRAVAKTAQCASRTLSKWRC